MERKKVLLAGDRRRGRGLPLRARRAAWPPHGRRSRISFLDRRRLSRGRPPRAIRMQPGHVLLKSRRAKHEDEFGPTAPRSLQSSSWTKIRSTVMQYRISGASAPTASPSRHARHSSKRLAGDRALRETAGLDLVAGSGERLSRPRRSAGLARAAAGMNWKSMRWRAWMWRAGQGGAHPAHASRLFRRCLRRLDHPARASAKRAPRHGAAYFRRIAQRRRRWRLGSTIRAT